MVPGGAIRYLLNPIKRFYFHSNSLSDDISLTLKLKKII